MAIKCERIVGDRLGKNLRGMIGRESGQEVGEKVGEKTGGKVGETLGAMDKLNLCLDLLSIKIACI